MDVSVIIINYHTAELIAGCLKSVFEKTEGISFEVIIVDNASGDGYEELLSAAFPGKPLKFLTLPENVGFGRANNAGFELASGRNILCLNPDTVLLNNAVKILSDYLDSHPECGACGGSLYDRRMEPAVSFRRIFPGIFWELDELASGRAERIMHGENIWFNHTGSPMEVSYINGADLMMPSKVVKRTGGFSPEFFMYFEETDLCRRIRRLGYRVMNVPSAKIQHLEGCSFENDGIPRRQIEFYEEGRMHYCRRNLNGPRRTAADLIHRATLRLGKYVRKSEGCAYKLEVFYKLQKKEK